MSLSLIQCYQIVKFYGLTMALQIYLQVVLNTFLQINLQGHQALMVLCIKGFKFY